ncbi:hypothetical protein PAMA_012549 [Pampus argenteus]
MGTGALTSRGQLGSRPHTPVGRVDIRPQDDPVMVPQTLYYTPASPKLEFKSTPNTPVTERWENISKPIPTYGSVHHTPSGRRPLGKAPKPDPRETPPIRPLESDADAVLTRLCGCDKLLQSLSIELAQLQMDKDSVQCALEVSRLQLEEWNSQGPRAQEEALTQKALLQEELVTVRARMCDVSLEMERVWSQYERMESELSVIRSQLQHICNFGMPQEQSQAQRELWMMEDILTGLKVNRDHFRFLLGLQRNHMFQATAPHPSSPGSPTERLQSGLPMDIEQEPPVRPPLPQELQESNQSRDQSHGWTESPYEGIYSHFTDPVHRRGNNQPDLLNVKGQKDISESQSSSKWITPDTTNQSSKKMKMSEEEQIERMKKNQERLTNRKKPPIPSPGAQTQSQSSETREEAPFPLRVTRVVTAVLPSSLVARRVSVEDPPPELDTPLPEQIPPEMQQRLAEQSKRMLNKPPRRVLLESPDQSQASADMHQDQPIRSTSRQQHQRVSRTSKRESRPEVIRAEPTDTSRTQVRDREGFGNGSMSLDVRAEEWPSVLLTSDMDTDLRLTPDQREAKLRRVERIRERVIRSAVRESAHNQMPGRGEGQEVHQVPCDTARKQRATSDHVSKDGCCRSNLRSPAEPRGISQDEDEQHRHGNSSKSQAKFGNKIQHKDRGGRTGVAKAKVKRPASPYHISSMTVYQKDGGKGFTRCKDGERLELNAADDDDDDDESNLSSDLRAKWFLSTNQWQGFIPLQIPGIDTLCNEEVSESDDQPACPDDGTESSEMSATVSQSLEKMKENHSLFYKIACDISISDTDITRNDGNSNAQSASPREEEEERILTESVADEATNNVGTSVQESNLSLPSDVKENNLSTNNRVQDSTPETEEKAALNASASPAKEACIHEEIPQNECEDTSRQEHQTQVKETTRGASVQENDLHQVLDEHAKTKEENVGMKESDEREVNQDRPRELKKSSSLREKDKETVEERGNNNSVTSPDSLYEGGRVIRSASFGKTRVTVIRTSL